MITLVKCMHIDHTHQLLMRIIKWYLDHMQSENGYFYYRQGKWIRNRIPYMRWGQAWAFHALTTVLNYLEAGEYDD